ncbi:hypothetical protein UlMin_011967 [Ulmus minor]
MIEGTYAKQYALLWDYCEELRKKNPGTTAKIKVETGPNGSSVFQRIYICLGACKRGFLQACRPLVGLDGCHTKGLFSGQLLSAVGADANNCVYPIAYSIVEQENKDTWSWFVGLSMEDLVIESGRGWTFITDRQKGLVQVLEELLPEAEHRYCVRHIYNNFNNKNKGEALRSEVWAIAKCTTVAAFSTVMERIKTIDKAAYEWLASKRAKEWSRSHFGDHSKCDVLLNNWCKSFNGIEMLLEAREKPILSCLEQIRKYLMRRWKLQLTYVGRWHGEIGDRVHRILEKNKLQSGWCHAISNGFSQFQITHGMGG